MRYTIKKFAKFGSGISANLFTSPTNISNAAWTKALTTVNNGGLSNQALMEQAVSGQHQVYQSLTRTNPWRARFSVDCIADLTDQWVAIFISTSGYAAFQGRFYNIGAGTLGSAQSAGSTIVNQLASINPAPGGGYTILLEADINLSSTQIFFPLNLATADLTNSYLGVVTNGMTLQNFDLRALGG